VNASGVEIPAVTDQSRLAKTVELVQTLLCSRAEIFTERRQLHGEIVLSLFTLRGLPYCVDNEEARVQIRL